MVDLHIHTNCSDGELTPTEVVGSALALGLQAVAITDHDTIAGNEEAVAAGQASGLPVIPGVEISTRSDGVTYHLLGYGLRRITERVESSFAFLAASRRQRNPQIVERFQRMGIDLSLEEVLREANGALLGRPHFARVLLRKGIVASVQEAFDRFLGRGAPAYVDKKRLSPEEACDVIREAGGVVVLAHPGLIEKERPEILPLVLKRLLDLGLAGVEVYYSRHTRQQVLRYVRLARDRGLIVTGGSDFHRDSEGAPKLGTGFGDLRVPDSCFEALRQRLAVPGAGDEG